MTVIVRYDRRVDEDFLALFRQGGVLADLGRLGKNAALPLDLQFRKDPKTDRQWATLYAGLTGILYVHRTALGVRFDAHGTWSGKNGGTGRYGFRPEWLKSLTLGAVAAEVDAIQLYLERVIPAAVKSHGLTEGAVQSVVSRAQSNEWAVLDREVVPSYVDTPTRTRVHQQLMEQLLTAAGDVAKSPVKLPSPPKSFGAECDLMALDRHGRVLAIEVKPMAAGTIAWVPAQAAMYARVIQHWIDADTAFAREVLAGMLEQRKALGHSTEFSVDVPAHPEVVPVVALQRGASFAAKQQLACVRQLIDQRSGQPPVEVYEVSVLGDFTPLR